MVEQSVGEWGKKLNRLSLKEFGDVFAAGAIHNMAGYYRATFVGPSWLRATARPAVAMGGLGNWWGKHIKEDGRATNLVRQGRNLETRLTMQLIMTTSVLDGKPALALHYSAENRFPWPYIVDELRSLDPETFLGMMHVNVGPLRKVAFPFLLQYQEQVDGL